MIKNYIKLAVRNLLKNRLFSFINISGLALGMAGAGLLLLNIQYELSVDQFHEKKDRVFKVYNRTSLGGELRCYDQTVAPLGPALQQEHAQVKQMTRVTGTDKLFSYGEKKLQVNGYHADAAFLDMFSFPLLNGSKQSALADKHSIVLTESLAKKLFGTEEALNKMILLDNTENVKVTGILQDPPLNSSMRFQYLLPWKDHSNNWDGYYASTYVELREPKNVKAVNDQIKDILSRHYRNELGTEIFLHPVSKMHTQHHFDAKGNPTTESDLYFLLPLATIMLLIGCINFMNLSTARSEKRAREVGVRKVMGAARSSLIIQFLAESIILTFLAGIIALLIVKLAWPSFSVAANVKMTIPWGEPLFWVSILGFILFTGIVAGSYPAFYLSSFRPIKVLKSIFSNAGALITPRRILVITQFVIAIFLINTTIIFRKQVNYTQTRDQGFAKEELLYHSITPDLEKQYNVVEQELMNTGLVAAVCRSSSPLTRAGNWINGMEWAGNTEAKNVHFNFFTTTGNFVRTNGLSLLEGRDLDTQQFATDSNACVINESAKKAIGFANPVGQFLIDGDVRVQIVGVVKNFYQGSPEDEVKPTLIRYGRDGGFINIRLKKEYGASKHIAAVEQLVKTYNPAYITNLRFASADLERWFDKKKGISNLINSFTTVAIFIACMGLLGLTAYMAELRKREIGIRKVMGASTARVTSLLTRDFVKLVVIAIIIASPLAWLFIKNYLQQFSYRTAASWWILPLSGMIAVVIAVCAIGSLAIKAAVANPVDALRSE